MNINLDGYPEFDDDDYFYCMGEEYGFECVFPDCDCDMGSFDAEMEAFDDDEDPDEEY